MEIEEEPYLEVLWLRDHLLKHKEFPLEKKEQAFNWYWRINGDQIVLRLPSRYPTSFTERDVPERIRWNPTKEGYRGVFEEWLKEKFSVGMPLKIANPVQGMEVIEPQKVYIKGMGLFETADGIHYTKIIEPETEQRKLYGS